MLYKAELSHRQSKTTWSERIGAPLGKHGDYFKGEVDLTEGTY